MSSVAVFWDRDNTLIKDPGFISDPGQVELLPGAAEALKRLTSAGFENIIVTNQSGLARGLFDEAALERVHDRMVALFAEQGAKIDAIYFCPYLPGDEAKVEKYRKDSELRKPKPGMILQASLERRIELAGSWMIGDSVRDTHAGRAAGCRTILIRRPGATETVRKGGDVDFVVDSIEQAAATVLKYTRRASGGQVASAPPAATPAAARHEAAPPVVPIKRGEVPSAAPVKQEVVSSSPASVRPDEPQAVAPTKPKETGPSSPVEPERVEPVKQAPVEPVVPEQVKPMKREIVEPVKRESIEPVRLDLSDTPVALERPEEPVPGTGRQAEAPGEATAVQGIQKPPSSGQREVAKTTVAVTAGKRSEAEPAGETVALLQEILAFLRTVDRRSRAEEFALGKLLGVIAQIMALGSLTWAVFGLIREEPIEARLGFAIMFQLMAMTCFVMSPKK